MKKKKSFPKILYLFPVLIGALLIIASLIIPVPEGTSSPRGSSEQDTVWLDTDSGTQETATTVVPFSYSMADLEAPDTLVDPEYSGEELPDAAEPGADEPAAEETVPEETTAEETVPEETETEEAVSETVTEETVSETAAEETPSETVPEETETTVPVEPTRCNILAIGDMLMHGSISWFSAPVREDGLYDYHWLFEPILNDLAWSDLAVVNNEVIFGGNELGICDYPNFSCFTSLGDTERDVGFDVFLSATNHTMDQDVRGVLNTLEYWSQFPDKTLLGIHSSPEAQEQVAVVERNGIRFGLLNMTYGLNGRTLPPDYYYLVDLMLPEERENIQRRIQWARQNTDYVIVFPHWGDEYALNHNESQREWAQFFADCGADLIIGTHSHTIQDSEWITAGDGRQTFCIYSLGNYCSLMPLTINVVGKVAMLTVEKDAEGTRLANINADYVLTYYEKGWTNFHVFRVDQVTDELLLGHAIPYDVNQNHLYENTVVHPMTVDSIRSLCR